MPGINLSKISQWTAVEVQGTHSETIFIETIYIIFKWGDSKICEHASFSVVVLTQRRQRTTHTNTKLTNITLSPPDLFLTRIQAVMSNCQHLAAASI